MKKWDFETIKEKADKFESRSAFKIQFPYLYKLSTKLQILDQIFPNTPSKTALKWDSVQKIKNELERLEIKTVADWIKKSAATHTASRRNNWFQELSKNLEKLKKANNYWNKNYIDNTHFKCEKCQKMLSLDNFHISRNRVNSPNCVHCMSIIKREDRKTNPDKYRKHDAVRYQKHKLERNFSIRMRNVIKNAMDGQNYSTSRTIREALGCTLLELKQHLEIQFKPSMSWENHSFHGWHIDHIRPLSSFDFIKEDGTLNKAEIFSAWNYKNLQPLWCKENLSKSDKYLQIGV